MPARSLASSMTGRIDKMMVSPTIHPELSLDGMSVCVSLHDGGDEVGRIVLETPELEAFMQEFAELRAGMAEAVPNEIDVGARVKAIVNPKWSVKVPSAAAVPSVVLVLRHPGHGWVASLLPVAEARNLATCLLVVSQEQCPNV
jgi:hypothetical protein